MSYNGKFAKYDTEQISMILRKKVHDDSFQNNNLQTSTYKHDPFV